MLDRTGLVQEIRDAKILKIKIEGDFAGLIIF